MMNIMKRLGLVFGLLFTVYFSTAKEVPMNVAKEYADTFFSLATKKSVSSSEINVFQHGDVAYTYIVNYKPEGWAIVSADDRAPAVIAYSEKGFFDALNIKKLPFYFWFESYENQIRELVKSDISQKHTSWTISNISKVSNKATVEPLIKVEWNQSAGWNASCPVDERGPGGRVYAGCVAVAMAQCMSVYKHPTQGYGSFQYNHSTYGNQYVNFANAQYKWDLMEDKAANEHVALLLYHLGVSVSMGYGYDGSGAYSTNVPSAIKNYFDYSNTAAHVRKSSYSDEAWVNLLKEELVNGRPIYYSGDGGDGAAGHAFNVDGVDYQDRFHLNWGWSGSYNGYFLITSLLPGTNNFSFGQAAVINFKPRDHKPYNITLSNLTVKENLPVGTVVGSITVADETPDDTHTLDIIPPLDIDGNVTTVPFKIENNKLITTEVLSCNLRVNYELTIKATDKSNNSYEKPFLISVIANPLNGVTTSEYNNFNVYKRDNSIEFTLNNNFSGMLTVTIYDLLGKMVKSQTYSKSYGDYGNSLLIEGFINGIYLVTLEYNNRRISKKIIL